jgi:catalase
MTFAKLVNSALALLLGGALVTAYSTTTQASDPTAQVDALEGLFGKHPGFRRSQAKGVCATGHFEGTREGAALTEAAAFSGDQHPVLARFSIGGGNPAATDKSKSARGLALKMTLPNGQQWQMANISAPMYFIAKAEHFAPFLKVRTPDPATGKPDPEALAAFNAAHPETLKQAAWLAAQPIGASYAGYRYWGVNAFKLTAASGDEQFVRWQFTPRADIPGLDEAALAGYGDDYLAGELAERLKKGPVTFDFHFQLAGEGDSLVDATTVWPDHRTTVRVGTLVLEQTEAGAGGACDNMMFNPLILPTGISPSDDPVLNARPAAYAVSFGRRASE